MVQQDRIHKAEDRQVGANTDRQRKHRHECEAGTLAQLAKPITYVLPYRRHTLILPHLPLTRAVCFLLAFFKPEHIDDPWRTKRYNQYEPPDTKLHYLREYLCQQ